MVDQPSKPLRVHGIFDIRCSGRVLIVEAEGPWNDDAARQYRIDLEQQIARLEPEPWAKMVIFRGEAILTPEAEQQLIEITRWRMSRGMQQIAVVLGNIDNRPLVEAQFTHVYTEAEVTFRFFETPDQALSWMAESGLAC